MPGQLLIERRSRESRTGGATVNGTDEAGADAIDIEACPDDKVREVWSIRFSNPNNAPVTCTVYIGDSTTHLRAQLGAPITLAAYGNFVYTDNISDAIAVVRPNTSGATTISNRLYAIVDANSMNVEPLYIDK